MMFEGGVVDAAGHSAAGKYWRSRTIFGKAAQYYEQSRETAEQLELGEESVKTYLERAYAKLGVSRRAEAVAEAHRLGLLGG